MRIAIIGAGGVGGYFGARLAAAGHSVEFVARGEHGRVMAGQGLRIESPLGDLQLRPVRVVTAIAELAPADAVLNCVKLWDLADTGRALAAVLPPTALVVPLQNGVEAAQILAESLGEARVAQGIAYISAEIARPGVVRHAGRFARLAFAPRTAVQKPRVAALLAACAAAGVEAHESDEVVIDVWRKFLMLTALAGATALRREPVGPIRDSAEGKALLEALVAEAAAVGRAEGVALPPSTESDTLKILWSLPADMRASMALDLERGNRLELPWLNGAVERLAEKCGVPVPCTKEVVAALAPFARGRELQAH